MTIGVFLATWQPSVHSYPCWWSPYTWTAHRNQAPASYLEDGTQAPPEPGLPLSRGARSQPQAPAAARLLPMPGRRGRGRLR